jgi:hypothetical protein
MDRNTWRGSRQAGRLEQLFEGGPIEVGQIR